MGVEEGFEEGGMWEEKLGKIGDVGETEKEDLLGCVADWDTVCDIG